jgi:hypothetical protein
MYDRAIAMSIQMSLPYFSIWATYCTTVANLLFNVGNDGTFGNGTKWQDVTNGQGSVFPCVDELTSVHALIGDKGLGA